MGLFQDSYFIRYLGSFSYFVFSEVVNITKQFEKESGGALYLDSLLKRFQN